MGTAVLLALPLVLVPGSASARPPALPTDVLYTTTNDADGNQVVAYRRTEAGLELIAAYPTGGLGTGARPPGVLGPPDVDQSIVVDEDRRLLFTVNERSDSIAVFRIGADASLSPVRGSPFPSGGENPASLGLTGNLLYVVNKDDDPPLFGGVLTGGDVAGSTPNYTAFRIAGNGRLTPVPHSTVPAPLGSSPTQALISPNGRLLFSSDFFGRPGVADGSSLRSLVIGRNGRLTDAPGSPVGTNQDVDLPAPAPDPTTDPPGFLSGTFGNIVVGLQVHPTEPLLYVGQPLNSFVGGNEQLGVYRWDAAGRLAYVGSVPAPGFALCWLVVSPDGRWLYATNTADNSLSVFDLSDPVAPQLVDNLILTGYRGEPFDGPGAAQFALAADEDLLYVTAGQIGSGEEGDNGLYVVRIVRDGAGNVVGLEEEALVVPEVGGEIFEPLGVVVL